MNKINLRLKKHYEEALKYFPEDRIVGLFLFGSQNYHLDTEKSDIDTRLLIAPSFDDIAFNKQPISTTHVLENGEHIDFKDIRLFFSEIRKQNINTIEILFTNYFILNPKYANMWKELIRNREEIAKYNPIMTVHQIRGMSNQCYKSLINSYESKDLCTILRLEDFLGKFINNENYENCLIPIEVEYLKQVKLGLYDADSAKEKGRLANNHINDIVNKLSKNESFNIKNADVEIKLDSIQLNIMKKAILNYE